MSRSPENKVFEYQKAQLHYHKTGKGKKILLAFHGFGQSRHHFHYFEHSLGADYTIYSFDLFYHGMSFWHEREQPLEKRFWARLMDNFFEAEHIQNFSLAGYSMGAKFALATFEVFPDRTETLILMAPDGIKTNFWYSLATYPSFLRKFFRGLVINPKPFYFLISLLSKINMLDKSLMKFAGSQMNSRAKRRRVYYSWVVFRLLKFDMKEIASLINEHQIKVTLFLGRHDKIITKENMKNLICSLRNCQVHVLECGHNTLIDEVGKFYKNLSA